MRALMVGLVNCSATEVHDPSACDIYLTPDLFEIRCSVGRIQRLRVPKLQPFVVGYPELGPPRPMSRGGPGSGVASRKVGNPQNEVQPNFICDGRKPTKRVNL